ncbi:MAG: WbqC family protein [Geminicoccaceae bacterium]
MTGLVAIHQPNFFPWLGYFDKIRRADVFVFLDEVDYPRAGSGGMGSWVNRVQIDMHGKPGFATCPVRRVPLGTPIRMIEIDDSQPWRRKLLKTLQSSYARCVRHRAALDLLEPMILRPETNLAAYNIANIKDLAAALGLETRFLRQSALDVASASTELLIDIVKAAGGSGYLAGGGAASYQDDHLFEKAGITLVMQHFEPTPYIDPKRFSPGLSVIDYLMHDGGPFCSVAKTIDA